MGGGNPRADSSRGWGSLCNWLCFPLHTCTFSSSFRNHIFGHLMLCAKGGTGTISVPKFANDKQPGRWRPCCPRSVVGDACSHTAPCSVPGRQGSFSVLNSQGKWLFWNQPLAVLVVQKEGENIQKVRGCLWLVCVHSLSFTLKLILSPYDFHNVPFLYFSMKNYPLILYCLWLSRLKKSWG